MRHTRERGDSDRIRHTLIFDDPTELVGMVCAAGDAGKFRRYMPRPFDLFGDAQKWYGRSDLTSWGQVGRLCGEVWEAGNARVRTLLDKLADRPFIPPRDLRRRPTWRDDGEGDFDLDRFCEGRDAWRGPKKRDVIGRQFLTFVVDVSAPYTAAAMDMYWRAAVAIAAAETLEQFGYGVEVIAAANCCNVLHPPGRPLHLCDQDDMYQAEQHEMRSGGWRPAWGRKLTRPVRDGGIDQDVFVGTWVKRADDPIDLGALTAACSPWFFRLIYFGAFGLVPGAVAHDSLGHGVEVEDERMDELTGPAAGERVYLAGVWSEPAATALLEKTLRSYADPEWILENPEVHNG